MRYTRCPTRGPEQEHGRTDAATHRGRRRPSAARTRARPLPPRGAGTHRRRGSGDDGGRPPSGPATQARPLGPAREVGPRSRSHGGRPDPPHLRSDEPRSPRCEPGCAATRTDPVDRHRGGRWSRPHGTGGRGRGAHPRDRCGFGSGAGGRRCHRRRPACAKCRQPMGGPPSRPGRRRDRRPCTRDRSRHDDPDARADGRGARTPGGSVGLARRARVGAHRRDTRAGRGDRLRIDRRSCRRRGGWDQRHNPRPSARGDVGGGLADSPAGDAGPSHRTVRGHHR